MRALTVLLLAGATLAPVGLMAQGQAGPQSPQAPQRKVQQVQAEDGGVSETLESIVIPPKLQAPFTLTLEGSGLGRCPMAGPSLSSTNGASRAMPREESIRNVGPSCRRTAKLNR